MRVLFPLFALCVLVWAAIATPITALAVCLWIVAVMDAVGILAMPFTETVAKKDI